MKLGELKAGDKFRFPGGSIECVALGLVDDDGFVNHAYKDEGDWSYGSDHPDEVVELVKEPTYAERQDAWVKQYDVKVGDKVVVMRADRDWDAGWPVEMDELVGNTVEITGIFSTGIKAGGWLFPFYVLEAVGEPSYDERQAEWVKANGVKAGDKVRVTRAPTPAEQRDWDNYYGWSERKLYSGTRPISRIESCGVIVGGDFYPYFVLELAREPKYRPYTDDEMRSLLRGMWVKDKQDGSEAMVTGFLEGKVRTTWGSHTADSLLNHYTFLDGSPCGVEE